MEDGDAGYVVPPDDVDKLAKRLAEMHGGSMAADSVADSGSVFTVRLPISGLGGAAESAPEFV